MGLTAKEVRGGIKIQAAERSIIHKPSSKENRCAFVVFFSRSIELRAVIEVEVPEPCFL